MSKKPTLTFHRETPVTTPPFTHATFVSSDQSKLEIKRASVNYVRFGMPVPQSCQSLWNATDLRELASALTAVADELDTDH